MGYPIPHFTGLVPTTSPIPHEHLMRLLEISTLLTATLDLPELLALIIEVAAEISETEEASLLLLDEKQGQLQFVATSNDPRLHGVTVPIDSSLAGWAVRHQEPLIVDDVAQDMRHYPAIGQMTDVTTRSMLVVPLIYKGRAIGALEAINKRAGARCTPLDIALLQGVAAQAAVALENARLFQQSDAVAEIMHELKTPLLALTAATDLLAHPHLPEDKRQMMIHTVQTEVHRLTRLTQDFLELSRLDSGRVRLNWELLDVPRFLHEVAAILRPQAALRQIGLRVRLPADELPLLPADGQRLRQVLLNLVSNGIKYNVEGGEVWLTAVYHPIEHTITLGVSDTGPGIEPQHMARLFDRFYRVPSSEGYTEGTGLGLSIAKRIIEAHGGRLEASSVVGQGTTFHCILSTEPLSNNHNNSNDRPFS
jgi:signal transduction histidine kinase